ncbi:MAG: hypothetical protein LBE12_08950 [Planctomycetaceae bacterium]|jgi:hypothetical protein|nr:hypothetical protein [Planctomycetaceae bacterium]
MRILIKYITLLFLSLFVGALSSAFSFSEEIDDKQTEANKLSVTIQWSHQCNTSNNHRKCLAGEAIAGFITVSGFPQGQTREQIEITVSIFDEKETTLIDTISPYSEGNRFLCINPDVSQDSTFQILTFMMILPEMSILSEGNYVLKLAIQDKISGMSGDDKLYFTIVSPNTFRLKNVFFCFIDTTNSSSKTSIIFPTVFTLPKVTDSYPFVNFQVNGFEVNENGEIDMLVKFTQYSEQGLEIENVEKSYSNKDFIRDKQFSAFFRLQKLYPGKYHVKIEVEDRNSKKKDSIELPYAVINSIDILNQYNYPKDIQPDVKETPECVCPKEFKY